MIDLTELKVGDPVRTEFGEVMYLYSWDIAWYGDKNQYSVTLKCSCYNPRLEKTLPTETPAK